jgi:transcriptional regulator with XRE-family HTH domain
VSIRRSFGSACRRGRLDLDLTQQQLADALGLHRGYLANVEAGRVNVSVDSMDRIATALGQRLELVVRGPMFLGSPQSHDTVHAWCSGYVARRLTTAGWSIAREVVIEDGDARGWIDLLAFQRTTATLAITEIKSRLQDLGALERQVGWYEQHAIEAARRLGWRPSRVVVWVVVLATDEVDRAIFANRDLFAQSFPGRADQILATLGGGDPVSRRSIALIDPASRRSRWLIRTRLEGRRSPAPYRDYADAARRRSV